jgi:hypothetical protein
MSDGDSVQFFFFHLYNYANLSAVAVMPSGDDTNNQSLSD